MNGLAEPDSQGCLLVVTSYADLADVIEPIVAIAATRIASAPMLGDFIEIRYVSSGPRPSESEDRDEATSRLVIDLTCPATGAAENYFALAAVDESATSISRLLADCAADPVIIQLRTKSRGFAIEDGKEPGLGRANPGDQAWTPDIVLSPPGGWTKKTLTDALWHYANQLLVDIASAGTPGLQPAQLARIRAEDDRIPVPRREVPDDDLVLDLRPPPAPDQAAPDQAAPAPGGDPTPDVLPRQRFARPLIPRWPASRRAGPEAASRDPAAQSVAGSAAALGNPQPAKQVAYSPPAMLLFMTLFGSSTGQQDCWRQSRSVLLKIDERMAVTPALGYWVRAFSAAEKLPHSELKPAGQLSKRDLRRPDRSLDFGPLLRTVLMTLTRDMRTTRRSAAVTAKPAVIFCPVAAPLADAVSMRAYTELTERALVLWIVSEQVNTLLSPDFGAGGARTFVDQPDVSDEISELLVAHADVRAGDGGRHRLEAPLT